MPCVFFWRPTSKSDTLTSVVHYEVQGNCLMILAALLQGRQFWPGAIWSPFTPWSACPPCHIHVRLCLHARDLADIHIHAGLFIGEILVFAVAVVAAVPGECRVVRSIFPRNWSSAAAIQVKLYSSPSRCCCWLQMTYMVVEVKVKTIYHGITCFYGIT